MFQWSQMWGADVVASRPEMAGSDWECSTCLLPHSLDQGASERFGCIILSRLAIRTPAHMHTMHGSIMHTVIYDTVHTCM